MSYIIKSIIQIIIIISVNSYMVLLPFVVIMVITIKEEKHFPYFISSLKKNKEWMQILKGKCVIFLLSLNTT